MTGRQDDLAAPGVEAKWRPSLAMVIGAVLTIVLTLPLVGMGAVVALSRSPDSLLASLSANMNRILATGLVIVAVTALVGFLFWRLVNRPMQDLVRWTEAVAARPQDRRPPAVGYGTQELARLAGSFDEMVARLRERYDYIATFTAHVSHELKSPLTSIAGAAELMRDAGDRMNAEARTHFLQNIETDTIRLSALVERMRDLARAENFRPGGSASLSGIADGLRKQFPALTVAIAGDATILPLPLEDALAVFGQLADNALAHHARTFSIRADNRLDCMSVVVCNDGEPISAGNRAKIFEPFYTTRRESGGTGMGLVIAQAMLKAHDGDITLDDTEAGVCFRLTLPGSSELPQA